MSHAIVIEIPETKDECFLAIPFTSEFENISNIIYAALGTTNIKAVKSDRDIKGTFISEEIMKSIRSARVIIAVCSKDVRYNTANPNVMLELGMARAIGKAVLVLIDKLDFENNSIPFDLGTIPIIKYNNNPLNKTELSSDLERELIAIINRMDKKQKKLIDPNWIDYNISEFSFNDFNNKPNILLNIGSVFKNFNKLIEQTNNIKGTINSLCEIPNSISRNDEQDDRLINNCIRKFYEEFANYTTSFQSNEIGKIIEKRMIYINEISSSIEFIVKNCSCENINTLYDSCKGFLETINESLHNYKDEHGKFIHNINEIRNQMDANPIEKRQKLVKVSLALWNPFNDFICNIEGLKNILIRIIITLGE